MFTNFDETFQLYKEILENYINNSESMVNLNCYNINELGGNRGGFKI